MPTVEWMYNYRSALGKGILNTGKNIIMDANTLDSPESKTRKTIF